MTSMTGQAMLVASGTPDCRVVLPAMSGLVHACPCIEAGARGEVCVSSLHCLAKVPTLASGK